jgi:hypothetical protein
LENINETVLPKWTAITSLKPDTIPIKTECNLGKYCRYDPQCPYLHPQMDEYESTIGQVNNTNKYNINILYTNMSAQTKTGRISDSHSKRDPKSRAQKILEQISSRPRTTTPDGQRKGIVQIQNTDDPETEISQGGNGEEYLNYKRIRRLSTDIRRNRTGPRRGKTDYDIHGTGKRKGNMETKIL